MMPSYTVEDVYRDDATRYAHRFMETHPKETVELIKEAYAIGYRYGRSLTDFEAIEIVQKARKFVDGHEQVKSFVKGVCIALIAFAIGTNV
jgi:hypothetical protein